MHPFFSTRLALWLNIRVGVSIINWLAGSNITTHRRDVKLGFCDLC
jgi:hypothetical protein